MHVNRNFLGKTVPTLSILSSRVINLSSFIQGTPRTFNSSSKNLFAKTTLSRDIKNGRIVGRDKKFFLYFANFCFRMEIVFGWTSKLQEEWIKMPGNIQKIVLVFALITSPKSSIKLSSYRGIYSYLMNVMQRLNFLFHWLLLKFSLRRSSDTNLLFFINTFNLRKFFHN